MFKLKRDTCITIIYKSILKALSVWFIVFSVFACLSLFVCLFVCLFVFVAVLIFFYYRQSQPIWSVFFLSLLVYMLYNFEHVTCTCFPKSSNQITPYQIQCSDWLLSKHRNMSQVFMVSRALSYTSFGLLFCCTVAVLCQNS